MRNRIKFLRHFALTALLMFLVSCSPEPVKRATRSIQYIGRQVAIINTNKNKVLSAPMIHMKFHSGEIIIFNNPDPNKTKAFYDEIFALE